MCVCTTHTARFNRPYCSTPTPFSTSSNLINFLSDIFSLCLLACAGALKPFPVNSRKSDGETAQTANKTVRNPGGRFLNRRPVIRHRSPPSLHSKQQQISFKWMAKSGLKSAWIRTVYAQLYCNHMPISLLVVVTSVTAALYTFTNNIMSNLYIEIYFLTKKQHHTFLRWDLQAVICNLNRLRLLETWDSDLSCWDLLDSKGYDQLSYPVHTNIKYIIATTLIQHQAISIGSSLYGAANN